ncbi:DUF1801 domain-containing protein [Microbacterium halophytorum]|uniref:DUF1801 domain-containing protein n=1 Tax=Microbacterium halophytorum TaxID=2067568 RepID=UPI000CFAD7CA|nr:DUF1801 domain-containing protein [Microbacterium halophytorum]
MGDIDEFLAAVTPAKRRRDAETLIRIMREITGLEPDLHGTIIGFGTYHYEYASGRSGDAPAAAFAPRKSSSVIYLMDGIGAHEADLAELGPQKATVGCLYINDLTLVDEAVLRKIIRDAYEVLTTETFRNRARESQR